MTAQSADQAEAYVRFQGASFREYLAKTAMGIGPNMALLVCERMMWELADFVQEVHGPTVVKEMLAKADDALQLDVPAPIIIPEDEAPDPYLEALNASIAAMNSMRESFTGLASIILARLPDAPRPAAEAAR